MRWHALAESALYQGVAQAVLEHPASLYDANFSPDGRHVVTASVDKTARIWSIDDAGDDPRPPVILRGHMSASAPMAPGRSPPRAIARRGCGPSTDRASRSSCAATAT